MSKNKDLGVPASPSGHSDEPASGLAADAGSVPNALLALAERCEAAEGPDRELDAAVAVAAKAVPYWATDQNPNFPWSWGGLHPGDYWDAPAYTASIDAALTLVDDQLVTVVMREALDRLDQCFDPMENYLAKLRLFVCAAALRARASVEGGVK